MLKINSSEKVCSACFSMVLDSQNLQNEKMTMSKNPSQPHHGLIYLIITVSIGFLYCYTHFIFTYYHVDQMQWL
jgi:hypothetical protein